MAKRGKKPKTSMNPKEIKVLKAFPVDGPVTLSELAKEAFPSMGAKSTTKGNSWTRNSLRYLIRTKVVKQVARGLYQRCVTKTNPKKKAAKAKRSSAPKNGKPKANPVAPVGAAEQSEAIF